MQERSRRLVVGISGASSAIFGIRLLEVVRQMNIESHLILSSAAKTTIRAETRWEVNDVAQLAAVSYDNADISAAIASGSFSHDGMIVIPCSIKTLSAVANSYTSNLISRAADVTLKEGRPLVLVVRETPLHIGHIRLMSLAAENGAVVFPPVPSFYSHPQSIEDIVDNIVGRILARIGIENDYFKPWKQA